MNTFYCEKTTYVHITHTKLQNTLVLHYSCSLEINDNRLSSYQNSR